MRAKGHLPNPWPLAVRPVLRQVMQRRHRHPGCGSKSATILRGRVLGCLLADNTAAERIRRSWCESKMQLFEMIKEQQTIVCCSRCDRSDVMVHGQKLWCSWCGKECAVAYRTVEVVSRQRFEALHVNASGTLVDPERVKPQPLRITSGWRVAMRNHFFEIDPSPELVRNLTLFNQTMLVLKHDQRGHLLDLGWSEELEFESGEYALTVYEGDYDGEVVYAFRSKDRMEIVRKIEAVLEMVSNYMDLTRKHFSRI
jgi:hypothetical protein